MSKDERLAVIAFFHDKMGDDGSTSVIAFGWDEAREKALELREWVRSEVGHQCRIEIAPDKPDENRSAFHGA